MHTAQEFDYMLLPLPSGEPKTADHGSFVGLRSPLWCPWVSLPLATCYVTEREY